jgi:hypothetical protein
VICSLGKSGSAEHTFTKCRFNNNHPKKDDYVEASFEGNAAATIKLIDCDMGDSTYLDKDQIEFINTRSGGALGGSIFGEGSLAIIVAFVALVVSIASIMVNVSSKKKTTPAQAEQNK